MHAAVMELRQSGAWIILHEHGASTHAPMHPAPSLVRFDPEASL